MALKEFLTDSDITIMKETYNNFLAELEDKNTYKCIIQDQYRDDYDSSMRRIHFRIKSMDDNLLFLNNNKIHPVYYTVYKGVVIDLASLLYRGKSKLQNFKNCIYKTWIKPEFKEKFAACYKEVEKEYKKYISNNKTGLISCRNSFAAHMDHGKSYLINIDVMKKLYEICLELSDTYTIPSEVFTSEKLL